MPYEKVGKNEPVCIADEIPFEIPKSWEWVRISSLGSIVRGSGIKRTETVEFGKPCVRYGELYTTYHTSFNQAISFVSEELFERCKHFSYGDILMTLTGENKPDIAKSVTYLGDEVIAAGGDLAYWTAHGMNPLYLTYLMASPYVVGRKINLATGDIIVHISGEKLGTILIPIPPLSEQQRIVEKILEVEVKLEEYAGKENSLNILQKNFPDILKKSILQEAIQGKLVPQDSGDEPASVLLERIRAEKQKLIAEGKIKKDKHESFIFRRDNSHYEKRGSEEVCIDDEIPFEIPENWCWSRLSALCKSISDGDHQPPPQVLSGVPFVVISNVSSGKIDLTDTRFVPHDYYENLHGSRIPCRDDILFTVTGSYGIVIPVDTEDAFCFQRHIALLKPLQITTEFLSTWLKTPIVYEQCKHCATGTAQKTVGLNSLKNILIPIPPFNEQVRILEQLEKVLLLITL